jgi:hypothetical protein
MRQAGRKMRDPVSAAALGVFVARGDVRLGGDGVDAVIDPPG